MTVTTLRSSPEQALLGKRGAAREAKAGDRWVLLAARATTKHRARLRPPAAAVQAPAGPDPSGAHHLDLTDTLALAVLFELSYALTVSVYFTPFALGTAHAQL